MERAEPLATSPSASFVLRAICLALVLFLCASLPAHAQAPETQAGLDARTKAVQTAARQEAQARRVRDAQARQAERYLALYREARYLEAEIARHEHYLADKRQELARLATERKAAREAEVRLAPLLDRAVEELAALQAEDPPFFAAERGDRLTSLRAVLTSAEAAFPERLGRVLEALVLEAGYGRDVSVRDASILLDGEERFGRTLRLGRALVYFLGLDGKAAVHAGGGTEWQPLESGAGPALQRAMLAAEGKRPPDLMLLPMPEQSGGGAAVKFLAFLLILLTTVLMAVPAPAAESLLDASGRARSEARHDAAQLKGKADELEREVAALKTRLAEQQAAFTQLGEKEARQRALLRQEAGQATLLTAQVRETAKDGLRLLTSDPTNNHDAEARQRLETLAVAKHFPGADEVVWLLDLLLADIRAGRSLPFAPLTAEERDVVTPEGTLAQARVYRLGLIQAFYQTPEGAGLLVCPQSGESGVSGELGEPCRMLPAPRLSPDDLQPGGRLPVDTTKGTALKIRLDAPPLHGGLWDRLRAGGPLVWPILAVALLGVAIIFERLLTLCLRSSGPALAERMRTRLNALDRPVSQEILSCAAEEVLLAETPRLERFLATLGVLAAVAPLLGLLGTVTGMITTFTALASQGPTSPAHLSGGISEALVTTQLGLAAAVPLLLAHHLLSRRVEALRLALEEAGESTALTLLAEDIRESGNVDGD